MHIFLIFYQYSCFIIFKKKNLWISNQVFTAITLWRTLWSSLPVTSRLINTIGQFSVFTFFWCISNMWHSWPLPSLWYFFYTWTQSPTFNSTSLVTYFQDLLHVIFFSHEFLSVGASLEFLSCHFLFCYYYCHCNVYYISGFKSLLIPTIPK